jgi:amino acid transporter
MDAAGSPGLARGSIGLPEVVFQSVTYMAPAAAVAFSIAIGAAFAGGALVLSVIIALLACLTVAWSIGQLAQHMPSAGGIYTFPAQGLHPYVGFLTGWGYAFVAALVGPLTALIFASQIAGVIVPSGTGPTYTALWIVFTILPAGGVFALNYFGVKVSTTAGTILGASEIIIFLALAVTLVIRAGGSNTLAPFGLSYATIKGYQGFSGVFAGAVYAMLAFIGFEASAPLAEETRDPRRNIKLAAIFSCLAIGLYYTFTTYAATVFFGPTKMASFAAFGGGSPWVQLAKDVWGIGWILALLAILNSAFANDNAATAASSRTFFAMARIRLLPAILERTHPRWRSPHFAVILQFLMSLVLGLGTGLIFGPVAAFILLATILTAVMIVIYMIFNLSCLVFYVRLGTFNPLLHGLVPVVGVLFLVPVLLASVGVGSSFLSFVSPLTYPISLTGPIVLIWMLIGLVYLIYLASQHKDRLEQTKRIFLDEPEPGSALAAP